MMFVSGMAADWLTTGGLWFRLKMLLVLLLLLLGELIVNEVGAVATAVAALVMLRCCRLHALPMPLGV